MTYFFLAYGKKKGTVKKKKDRESVWVLINDVCDHVQGLFAQQQFPLPHLAQC